SLEVPSWFSGQFLSLNSSRKFSGHPQARREFSSSPLSSRSLRGYGQSSPNGFGSSYGSNSASGGIAVKTNEHSGVTRMSRFASNPKVKKSLDFSDVGVGQGDPRHCPYPEPSECP